MTRENTVIDWLAYNVPVKGTTIPPAVIPTNDCPDSHDRPKVVPNRADRRKKGKKK